MRQRDRLVRLAVSLALAGVGVTVVGCKHHAPPQKPAANPSAAQTAPVPVTPAATEPTTAPLPGTTTAPTTAPATMPSTLPATLPTTQLIDVAPPIAPAVPAAPATAPAAAPGTTEPITAATPTSAPTITPATAATGTTPPIPVIPATAPTAGGASGVAATRPAPPAATQAALPHASDPVPPTDNDNLQADSALAARIASIAELSFPDKVPTDDLWPIIWKHQASLYAAAGALDRSESRYFRLQADCLSHAGDVTAEAVALYKATLAKPDDEFSWNRRLDLFLSQSQTAESQIAYCHQVMDAPGTKIPANVKAHAGFRCAQTLLDRGDNTLATAVLEEALRDNPSSVECLKLRYSMLPATAPRYERVSRLLDLLRANPLQSQYSGEACELIAASGLVRASLPWYVLAISTAHQQGDAASATMLNYAAAQYMTDQKMDAFRTMNALLRLDPGYYPAWYLQSLLVKNSKDKESQNKVLAIAQNVFYNRLVDTINRVSPVKENAPTTRPLNDAGGLKFPDLPQVVARLNESGNPQAKQEFAAALADFARFYIFFTQKSEPATPLIDAMHGVLTDEDPQLVELQGWQALLSNKPDEARSKFSSIAATDPLAQLGLVKLLQTDPSSEQLAESMARKLLQDHPSGLVGAMIWEAVKSDRVRLVPPASSDALSQLLGTFPTRSLALADHPTDFYSVHVFPVRIGCMPGEPILANVQITNAGTSDLTIGDDGIIKPQLLFSLDLHTSTRQSFVASDTLACPLVIKPMQSASQVVRLDQTQLLSFLNSNVSTAFEIRGTLSVNETTNRLGGYMVQVEKPFYRWATPITMEKISQAVSDVATASPDQQITALGILEIYVLKLHDMKTPDGNMDPRIPSLLDTIHKARSSPLPAVAVWASKCEFDLSNAADRSAIVHDLASDDDWRHRQMAVILLPLIEHSDAAALADRLTYDTVSPVQADAITVKAALAIPNAFPTTAPTTMPSTQP